MSNSENKYRGRKETLGNVFEDMDEKKIKDHKFSSIVKRRFSDENLKKTRKKRAKPSIFQKV